MSWWSVCAEYLTSLPGNAGKSADEAVQRYRKGMKDRLANCIGAVFFDRLIVHLNNEQQQETRGLQGIAKRLDVAYSNLSRWYSGEVLPNANKFFVGVVDFDVRLKALDQPARSDAIRLGVAKALEQIRTKDLRLPKRRLRVDELFVVSAFYALPTSYEFFSTDGESRNRVLARVLRQVAAEHPETNIANDQQVRGILRDWLLCYALYSCGHPERWRFLNEDSA